MTRAELRVAAGPGRQRGEETRREACERPPGMQGLSLLHLRRNPGGLHGAWGVRAPSDEGSVLVVFTCKEEKKPFSAPTGY